MKHVLTFSESAELELLKNILEEGGIHCVIKNEQSAPGLAVNPSNPELWVLNDDDFSRAKKFCHDWFDPGPNDLDVWVCLQCEQGNENRLDACWKCGATREIAEELDEEAATTS